MIYVIAQATVADVNVSAFFGFMGVTMALVLASINKQYKLRYRCCLWNIQIRCRNRRNRYLEARNHYEVINSSCHGWYLGNIRHDCGGSTKSIRYMYPHYRKVKQGVDYTPKKGFAHMAAGLACGFSCVAAGFAIGVVGEAGVKANA